MMYNLRNCPCRNCEERREMCHALCRKYAEWSEEYNKVKAANRRDMEADSYEICRSARIKAAIAKMLGPK